MKEKLKFVWLSILAVVAVILYFVMQKKGIDLQKTILDTKKKLFDEKIQKNKDEIMKIDSEIEKVKQDNSTSKEIITTLEKKKVELNMQVKKHEVTTQELVDKFNRICG